MMVKNFLKEKLIDIYDNDYHTVKIWFEPQE